MHSLPDYQQAPGNGGQTRWLRELDFNGLENPLASPKCGADGFNSKPNTIHCTLRAAGYTLLRPRVM